MEIFKLLSIFWDALEIIEKMKLFLKIHNFTWKMKMQGKVIEFQKKKVSDDFYWKKEHL
jgi:hypothetical protein